MAFNYYTKDSIKLVDVDNIPVAFVAYFEGLDEVQKDEIREIRPDLYAVLYGNNDENIPEQEFFEEEPDDEYNVILDEWESIKVSDWHTGRIKSEVIVCKVVPNGITSCKIHRLPLKELELVLEYGVGNSPKKQYHILGY